MFILWALLWMVPSVLMARLVFQRWSESDDYYSQDDRLFYGFFSLLAGVVWPATIAIYFLISLVTNSKGDNHAR